MSNNSLYEQYKEYIVYRCVIGSKAYRLDTADSDIDERGIFVAPTRDVLALHGVPEHLIRGEDTFWEIGKFIRLALRANPNILECFDTSIVIQKDRIIHRVLENTTAFLSQRVYRTYRGYAVSQLQKAEKKQRDTGVIGWKNVMHMIRLLICGLHILQHENLKIDMSSHRKELLSIRNGEQDMAYVIEWQKALENDIDEAFVHTALPIEPNEEFVNALLLDIRYQMFDKDNFW